MSGRNFTVPRLSGVTVQLRESESTEIDKDVAIQHEQGQVEVDCSETRQGLYKDSNGSQEEEEMRSAPPSRTADSVSSTSTAGGHQQGLDDRTPSLIRAYSSVNGTSADPGSRTAIFGASIPNVSISTPTPVRRKPLIVRHPAGVTSASQYSDLPEVVPSEYTQTLSLPLPEAVAATSLPSIVSDLPEVVRPPSSEESRRLQDVVRGPPAKRKTRSTSTSSQTGPTPLDNHMPLVRKPIGSQAVSDNKAPQTSEAPAIMVATEGDVELIDRPDLEGFPQIVRAASEDQLEVVRTLLNNNANIEARHTVTGRTALAEASSKGHSNIVELLIRHGCRLDSLDADSYSALHLSAANGDISLTKYLLDRGATVGIKGSEDLTPLHVALRHPDIVMLLLHRQADVHARSSAQRTPLHMSAAAGIAQTCDVLINLHGAQFDARDSDSRTPLQVAVEAQQTEIVNLLLSRMNLKPKDPMFTAALFAAIETGNARMAEVFFEQGASLRSLGENSYKPATLTAKSGSVTMLELMISRKCKLKEKDKNGWSALHFAAQLGHTSLVERLLDKDLSIKATIKTRETPLILAVKGGHFAATDLLLRGKGVSQVKTEDFREQQPLHHAARIGDVSIAKLLLSHKADVHTENSFGWRPLHLAVAYGHTAMVELLLDAGASVEGKLGKSSVPRKETHNMVANRQWAEARWPYPDSRPVHLAIEYGRDDIAQLLLNKGTKIEASCSENWRPIHHAAFSGNVAMTEQLLKRNVNVHAVTCEGKTALQLAQYRITTGGGLSNFGADYRRVQSLLNTAMLTARRQTKDQWKSFVAFNGKKAQHKHEAIKAATSR